MAGFPPRQRKIAERERRSARTTSKGHGRLECRTLTTTSALTDYVDWPALQQCFRLVRRRTLKGTITAETVYGITSLTEDQAGPERLLKLIRNHWQIENGVFHVRDMTFGEDACRVRTGNAPHILAVLRNVAINLLNGANTRNKAQRLRRHAAHPHEALALILDSA